MGTCAPSGDARCLHTPTRSEERNMAIDVQEGHNVWCAVRWSARISGLVFLSALTLAALLPIVGLAQDTPWPTPTPHWITAPSLPVRGPIVRRTQPLPGVIEPTPAESPQHEHLVGIAIGGEGFMMHPGPCAFRVEAAILAHEDLFTGEQACDSLIRQARAIQRRREAENPAYAHEPRITPEPTPAESGVRQSQQ
jgi:hypothetical protein